MVSKKILKRLYSQTVINHRKFKRNNGTAGYPIGVVLFSNNKSKRVIWSGMNAPYDVKGADENDKHAEQRAIVELMRTSELDKVTSLLVSKPPCPSCAPLLEAFPNLKNIFYIAGDKDKEVYSKNEGYNIQKNIIPNDVKPEIKKQMENYTKYIIDRFREAERTRSK